MHHPYVSLVCFNSSQVDYKQISLPLKGLYLNSFQFLIGRLQTGEQRGRHNKGLSVSIPHRQTTNTGKALVKELQKQCFNSSQVDYKPGLSMRLFYEKPEFQFLIGRLQTRTCRCHATGTRDSFNSSQVDYKLSIVICGYFSNSSSFNSSQVDYKPDFFIQQYINYLYCFNSSQVDYKR